MRRKIPVLLLFVSLLIFSAAQQQNSGPVVKITSPAQGSVQDSKTQIRYSISVSDREDGESKYEEIHPNEVFLKVKYLKDSTLVKPYLEQRELWPEGLRAMRMSNCFNCHTLKSPLIGPSFQDISRKYPHTAESIDLLSKHVKEGSLKIWGDVPMPAHPELTAEQIRTMIEWINANAEMPDLNYYTGLGGSFQFKSPSAGGILVLSASYLDHGLKDIPGLNQEGSNTVSIHIQ